MHLIGSFINTTHLATIVGVPWQLIVGVPWAAIVGVPW